MPTEESTTTVGTAVTDGSTDASQAFRIVDATVTSVSAGDGTDTTVRATVENPSERTVTGVVPVTVDGDRVAAQTLTLDGGARETVELRFDATEDGSVTVGEMSAGRIEVGTAAAETPSLPDPFGFPDSFRAFLAVLVVLSVGLAAYSRTDWDGF